MQRLRKCVLVLFVYLLLVIMVNPALSTPLYMIRGKGAKTNLYTSCPPLQAMGKILKGPNPYCKKVIDFATEQYATTQAKAAYQKASKEITDVNENVTKLNSKVDDLKTVIKESLTQIPKDLLVNEVVQLIKEQVLLELKKELGDVLDK
ncbi:MAG: hypothetical protein ISR65_05275 [Bacteriovoracaceae bacterium]|nr:hypothetical protein [Bacteriovoracaceae bacterium]